MTPGWLPNTERKIDPMKRITRRSLIAAAAVAAITLVAGCAPTPAQTDGTEEAVTLRLVTPVALDAAESQGLNLFLEMLEERAPWITVQYIGGPEAIDPFEQGEAVRSGAVDLTYLPEHYYTTFLPYGKAMKLTPFTPMEERENGVMDLYQAAHEAQGIHYLGKVQFGVPYKFYFRDEVDGTDFSGLTIRGTTVYEPLIAALGGTSVQMAGGEIYTSLERGVINGLGWGAVGMVNLGLQDVARYELEPGFYQVNQGLLFNLDRWNGLSEGTREALTETIIAAEKEIEVLYQNMIEEEIEVRADAGMSVIELTGADREDFLATAYDVGWTDALQSAPEAEELREIFGN